MKKNYFLNLGWTEKTASENFRDHGKNMLAIKDAASCIKEFLQDGYSAIDIAESEVFKSTIQTIINSYLCYKN